MLNLVSSAITGLIVGAIARLILPGAQNAGLFMTMLFGLGGSLLAGFVIHRGQGGFQRAGFLASVLGALVVVFAATRLGYA